MGHSCWILATQKQGDLRENLKWEDESFSVPRNTCIYIFIYAYIHTLGNNFKMEKCQLSLSLVHQRHERTWGNGICLSWVLIKLPFS